MSVDFIIIGAQKGGTTSLAASLAQHPSVCFSSDKEPGFFSKYPKDSGALKNYHQLFEPLPGQLLGEASTMYTMLPENCGTAERIFQYNPRMKLIYIMRDPVERIISHYAHRYVRKRADKNPYLELANNSTYLFRSRYYYQLQPYLSLFPIDNLLLLVFEDFISNPKSILTKAANFLNIDPDFYNTWDSIPSWNRSEKRKILPDYGISKVATPLKKLGRRLPTEIQTLLINFLGNSIKSKPVFSPALKSELYEQLKDDIVQVEGLIGHGVASWKDHY